MPGQDPPREVVDHPVQVDLGSVEEPDHSHVDMPCLIGRGRPEPFPW
jgi:hypothetical protein